MLAFTEKPQTPEEIITDQINAGCYVFRRSVIDSIPAGRPVSVERETFPGLLAAGATLHGVTENTYWMDLGKPESIIQASADLVRGVVPSPAVPAAAASTWCCPARRWPPAPSSPAAPSWGPEPASGPEPSSRLHRPRRRRRRSGRQVSASLIGARAAVGERTVLDGTVVGDGAVVGADNELRAGARVWCEARLPDAVIRFSPDA